MPNTYIGTKMVKATPMTRQDYNTYRGWELPADENGADEGYLVEYLDGGKPNHPDHHGYISWSPKEQFDGAYDSIHTGMTFGHALVALEAGERVMRAGWNGKGMWLYLIHVIDNGDPKRAFWDLDLAMYGVDAELLPWIGMKTANNKFVPWLASQTDMLARDWMVIRQEDNMAVDLPYDAELTQVVTSGPLGDILSHDIYLHGIISGDRQQRFPDGQWVNTSKVIAFDEVTRIATTKSGTRYKVTFAPVDGSGNVNG